MKALILNNKVVDIASVEFAVSSTMTWLDCSDDCKAGWTVEDGVLTAPPAPQELTWDKKRERRYPRIQDQLDMQYWDSVNGTTTPKDLKFLLSPLCFKSRQNLVI